MLELARRHGLMAPLSVADIACGPAHHLRELARRGLRGYGIELNREMVAYARSLSTQQSADIRLQHADMRTFSLKPRVDMALCLFDSFSHCITDADAVATLRATAKALKQRGLLFVELTHPADYFSTVAKRTSTRWTQRYPEATVKTRFSTTRIDPIEETYVASMTIDATFGKGHRAKRIVDRQLHRMWFKSSMRNVSGASGAFEPVGWYGDFTPDVPLTSEAAAWRMLVVLRRR